MLKAVAAFARKNYYLYHKKNVMNCFTST